MKYIETFLIYSLNLVDVIGGAKALAQQVIWNVQTEK